MGVGDQGTNDERGELVEISVYQDKGQMARAAATKAAQSLKTAIATKGQAVVVFAAATSQLEFLEYLTSDPNIDWDKTVVFQLDEYIGIEPTHSASFRRFLDEHVIGRVAPGEVHLIAGEKADSQSECDRLNQIISALDVDVALVGIGENGHLAFNDPPADFETEAPYIVVELDDADRIQQAGEGWFATIDDVPRVAITMSIREIMRFRVVVCTVPDRRKAKAVRDCLTGDVSPLRPASILQEHENAFVFLDSEAAGDQFLSDRKGQWEVE